MKIKVALIIACSVSTWAQSTLNSGYKQAIKELVQHVPEVRAYAIIHPGFSCMNDLPPGMKSYPPEVAPFCVRLNALGLLADVPSFATYALLKSTLSDTERAKAGAKGFLQFLEARRLDEQLGAGSSSSGTNSVASRAGFTDIINLAIEAGAITQSANGSSATFQANALSLERFVLGQEVLPVCVETNGCESGVEAFLKNLSGTTTFDLTHPATIATAGTVAGSGSPTPVTATALVTSNSVRLSSFSVRYQFASRFSLRDNRVRQEYLKQFTPRNTDLVDAGAKAVEAAGTLVPLFDFVRQTPKAWSVQIKTTLEQVVAGHAASSDQDLNDALALAYQTALDDLIQLASAKGLLRTDSLVQIYQAQATFSRIYSMTMDKVREKALTGFSVEYTSLKPAMQPRTSNVKGIVAWHPKSGDANLTFNFSATFYNTKPTGAMSNWKDAQVAMQLDRHLGETRFGDTTFTLAGYYQYQHEASVLQITQGNLAPNTGIVLPGGAATLLAPKGHIAVAQAQFTVKSKTGTRLPLGVTWSNRTELIKAKELRGHIGYNFDWDSLWSAFNGKKPSE